MKSCDKQCSVYKIRAIFLGLYKISWGLTIVEIVTAFFILLRAIIMFWWKSVSIDPVGWLSGILPAGCFGGLKDVSMTVGLTGVLFAWLLQIIGDQTCGIQMDELFRFEFPGYIWQMFFFIQATMICIYTCNCKDTGRLLAPLSFLNMLCGIVNMWLMCVAFLFSTSKRRDIAFCCLKDKLLTNWNIDNLSLWAQELNTCATRGETQHIEMYFDLVRSKADETFNPEKPELCAEFCGQLMDLTWTTIGNNRWSQYLAYLLNPPYNNEISYFLLGTYLLQAARLGEKEVSRDRYLEVVTCLSKGTERLNEVPAFLLAIYLAFYTIHQSVSIQENPEKIFDALQKIKWDKKLDVYQNRKANYRKYVLKWILWIYGVVFANDYQAYICKQGENLERAYDHYMNFFPWKYIE